MLDPGPVVAAVTGAFPGGEAALPLTRHPVAGVRAAAAVAAAASGSPAAAARLAELAGDPDAQVAGAARGAAEATRRRPPPLSFRVLGPFAVRRGELDGRRRRLAAPDRPARRADAARPPPPPGARGPVLRGAVARPRRRPPRGAASRSPCRARAPRSIRPAAQAQPARGPRAAYRLALSERDVVDADVFVAAADRALRRPPRRAAASSSAPRELWSGEPLPEERYADWATVYRERLIDRYADVLAALTDACEASDDRSAALAAARRLVELDPLDESAHRRVMPPTRAPAGARTRCGSSWSAASAGRGAGARAVRGDRRLQRRILVGETP